ncbi:MAG: hypothetical protein JO023_20180 [Chloroflexi bacterium]|nr:hypothetical protein [Chloroflexota bacterium]
MTLRLTSLATRRPRAALLALVLVLAPAGPATPPALAAEQAPTPTPATAGRPAATSTPAPTAAPAAALPAASPFYCTGSGDAQTYTMPAGVARLAATVVAAQGGRGHSSQGRPGYGAEITATIPGQQLQVVVGCAGDGSRAGLGNGGIRSMLSCRSLYFI